MFIGYCGNCMKMSPGESPGRCSHCGRDEIITLSDKEVIDEINKLRTKLKGMMSENLKLARTLNNAKHKAEQVSGWLEVEIVNKIFDDSE